MANALLAGEPVEDVLERKLTPSVEQAREHSLTRHTRLYGELSDVMMRLHRPEIAMALEKYGARTADGKTKITADIREMHFRMPRSQDLSLESAFFMTKFTHS
jgi:hypothetical protein